MSRRSRLIDVANPPFEALRRRLDEPQEMPVPDIAAQDDQVLRRETAGAPDRGPKPPPKRPSCAAAAAASNIVDVDDAGKGFDGGAGLRTDLEATGDGDLDLAGGQVENDGDAAAAAAFTGDDA